MTVARKYPQSDVKILYGLAAGRCAFPDCRIELVFQATSVEERVQIGHIAHIHGRKDDPQSQRYDPLYPEEKLDTYDNWILLCPTCHAKVDPKNQESKYSAEDLQRIKPRISEVGTKNNSFCPAKR
jgi:hypothetical protein